jgi:hypothetical protein
VKIEHAARKFDSHFVGALLPIALSAIVAKSNDIGDRDWTVTSGYYCYQFVLGLGDPSEIGRRRLGLKGGHIRGLQEFVEGCVRLKQQAAGAIRKTVPSYPAVESSATKLVGI